MDELKNELIVPGAVLYPIFLGVLLLCFYGLATGRDITFSKFVYLLGLGLQGGFWALVLVLPAIHKVQEKHWLKTVFGLSVTAVAFSFWSGVVKALAIHGVGLRDDVVVKPVWDILLQNVNAIWNFDLVIIVVSLTILSAVFGSVYSMAEEWSANGGL